MQPIPAKLATLTQQENLHFLLAVEMRQPRLGLRLARQRLRRARALHPPVRALSGD